MDGNNDLVRNEAGEFVERFQEPFNYEILNTVEDRIREALASGGSLTMIVQELIEAEASERVNEAIGAVLCLIAESRRPKLMIDHIAYVTGMPINEGMSVTQLARKHGQKKQAFSQAALRLAKKLGLKPSRQMRSLKARKNMAKAYRERHEATQEEAGDAITKRARNST